MGKWIQADAKAWPQGYSSLDTDGQPVSIAPGGVALVSDAKAAQLAADFPKAFREVTEKEAEKLAAKAAPAPTAPAPPAAAKKESE